MPDKHHQGWARLLPWVGWGTSEEEESEALIKTPSGLGDKDVRDYGLRLPAHYWPTAAYCGVMMCAAAEYLYVTPTYLAMGVSTTRVGYLWMGGSIAILFIIPVFGALSDYTNHAMGRRRIYIAWALLAALCGLLTFAYAESIGYLLGDTDSNHDIGITVAVCAQVLAEVGGDTIIVMTRALCTDVLSSEQLPSANAFFAFNGGLGCVMGFGLGSLDLTSTPVLSMFDTNMRALYVVATTVLCVGTLITLTTSESRHVLEERAHKHSTFTSSFKRSYSAVFRLPTPVARAFIAHTLNVATFALFYFFSSDWMGKWVYGGSSDTSSDTYYLYEDGVQAASFGYLLMATVSILTSFALEHVSEHVGVRSAWILSLCTAMGCFVAFYCVPSGGKVFALCLYAVMGIPLACQQLPWTIVTRTVRRSRNSALYLTIFRLAEVLPWVLMGLLSGVFIIICEDSERATFLGAAGLQVIAVAYSQLQLLDPDESACREGEEVLEGIEGSEGRRSESRCENAEG